MSNSRKWSNASAPCRIELRGSRAIAVACAVLGVLAAVALPLTALPDWLAWAGSVVCVLRGSRLARRELALRDLHLTLHRNGQAAVDGEPVHALRIRWRGAIAFVDWTDAAGRIHRRVLAPDVLPPASRRELRLGWSTHAAALGTAEVAP